jgi:hypothetical protein
MEASWLLAFEMGRPACLIDPDHQDHQVHR